MGLFSRDKPKIKIQTSKKDGFSGWLKCTHCNELIHTKELEENLNICPKCDYHYRLNPLDRIAILADEGSFMETNKTLSSVDTLEFFDVQAYKDRLEDAKKATGHEEAILTGFCTIENIPLGIAVFDFNFMGGSMGSAVGEKLTRLIEEALARKNSLLIVSTSGGARMQESILSLMQMAKTSCALQRFAEAKLPYISLFTNPTTGGVTASFASLGDVILAEPHALICFAGPRVIEQTIGQKLPPEAQKSEFLLKHGMIDVIVRRPELKKVIAEILSSLLNLPTEETSLGNITNKRFN